MPRIVKCQNKWCIEDSYYLSSEPKMVTVYYPIGKFSRIIDINYFEMTPVVKTNLPGEYMLYINSTIGRISIYLSDMGKTIPIETLIKEVSCPKVRKGIEVKWKNGCWQKYLRSAGWVSA